MNPSMKTAMNDEIKRMQQNDTDFYEQVAGDLLSNLRKMYGESLNRTDVDRVIEHLIGFSIQYFELSESN